VTHAEDLTLRGEGTMNEGAVASRLGLSGIPNACEVTAVARDLELAALTGGACMSPTSRPPEPSTRCAAPARAACRRPARRRRTTSR